ncbi:MAG TPA: hypothetical protein VE710_01455 [Candidatus Bathyarchaeia archaeon]|nr:hypothetical protein [Candidatus Bathyarchaeia archaeon]
MLKVIAEIYILTKEEGGVDNDIHSGVMPSFKVNGDLIACRIISKDRIIPKGKHHIVELEFPYGEIYSQYIIPGLESHFHSGAKIEGSAKIIKIIE